MDIKDIFPVDTSITLCDNIVEKLDRRRQGFEADRNLLTGDPVMIDINNITQLPDGKIRIDINGARFECFFHRGNTKKLYVILNGAAAPSKIPFYCRWSWYAYSDYSWLSIDDPTYFANPKCMLGWFYGDTERNYRQYVAQIATEFSKYLDIERRNVIFYGSSGGGTAAIHSAACFGDGTAVAINGQLNFESETFNHKIAQFEHTTGIDLSKPDKWLRNDICSVIGNSSNVNYIIIENLRSAWDLEDHLKFFADKLGVIPEYGLSQNGNITFWLYESLGGSNKTTHSAVENKNIFYAIDFLVGLVQNGEELEKYKPLYLLFNEFWYDIYSHGAPTEVTGFTGTATSDSITLKWNRSANTANYKLQMLIDGGWLTIAAPTETTYTVTGLKSDTAYNFRIFARCGNLQSIQVKLIVKTK